MRETLCGVEPLVAETDTYTVAPPEPSTPLPEKEAQNLHQAKSFLIFWFVSVMILIDDEFDNSTKKYALIACFGFCLLSLIVQRKEVFILIANYQNL